MADQEKTETLFAEVPGTNVATNLVRTAQQHHVHLSAMADVKVNILITVSSLVLTFVLSRLEELAFRPALLTLGIFTLAALILAVLAILPKLPPIPVGDRSLPSGFNLLFFGHFAHLSEERYLREMDRAMRSDAAMFRLQLLDLYEIGVYLHRRKFRYLRWSYLALILGFIAATAIQFSFMYLT